MHRLLTLAIALSSLAAVPALAQAAAPAAALAVKADALLATADGRKLGRIERLIKKDGVAVAANIIVDSHVVAVPVATITPATGGYVTSLTYAEVRKIK